MTLSSQKTQTKMELSSFYLMRPNQILSPLSMPKPKISPIPSPKSQTQKMGLFSSKQPSRSTAVLSCAKLGAIKEQEDNEWEGIGESWREKCRGEGIVEVMECLEREAIMGEDHGRDASDYNRRAQIFDKSNRVFQALKEKKSNSEMLIS